jgi:hypothetical protein
MLMLIFLPIFLGIFRLDFFSGWEVVMCTRVGDLRLSPRALWTFVFLGVLFCLIFVYLFDTSPSCT